MDNKNFVANEEATFVAPSQNSPEMNSQPEMAVVPSSNHPGPPPDYFTDDLPPAYQVASALPTYEEAELTKGKINDLSFASTETKFIKPKTKTQNNIVIFGFFQKKNIILAFFEII